MGFVMGSGVVLSCTLMLVAIILMRAETSRIELTPSNPGVSESVWIKTIPTMEGKLILDKTTSQAIRNRMSGKVTDILEDTMMITSPSLDLLAKDTRDETYVDPKTLSASHNDLIRHSSSKLSSLNSQPSCEARQVRRKILFSHCPGELILITIGGTMKMNCRDIEQGEYYGPVIMVSSRCSQSFVFRRDCEQLSDLSIKSTECDSSIGMTRYIVQTVVCAIIVIILIITIIWLHRVNKGIKTTAGFIRLNRVGKYYKANYNEWYDDNGEHVFGLLGKESKLNATR